MVSVDATRTRKRPVCPQFFPQFPPVFVPSFLSPPQFSVRLLGRLNGFCGLAKKSENVPSGTCEIMRIRDFDGLGFKDLSYRSRTNDVRDAGIHFGSPPKSLGSIFSHLPVPGFVQSLHFFCSFLFR